MKTYASKLLSHTVACLVVGVAVSAAGSMGACSASPDAGSADDGGRAPSGGGASGGASSGLRPPAGDASGGRSGTTSGGASGSNGGGAGPSTGSRDGGPGASSGSPNDAGGVSDGNAGCSPPAPPPGSAGCSPPPPPSARDSVTVDMASAQGAPTYRASGFIYGIAQDGSQPPNATLSDIKIQALRVGGAQIGCPNGGYVNGQYTARWSAVKAYYA